MNFDFEILSLKNVISRLKTGNLEYIGEFALQT